MSGSPRLHPRHLVAVAATLAAVLAAAVLSAFTAQATGPGRYVALGDSYTSGPLIPPQLDDPLACQRSADNYPHLVAAALGLDLVDMSCSGALTSDLFGRQSIPGGTHQPQLDAVDASTDVVTLGIGGQDIGFSQIVHACVAVAPAGQPCQDLFADPGGDQITSRVALAGMRVAGVLAEIRRRAPDARVLVVGYPTILPPEGLGCWPMMPFAYADVGYLRAKLAELNAMLAEQAGAAGATYVDTAGPSVGHDACTALGVRWIEPVVPVEPALPVHPNALGMRAEAAVVAHAIDPDAAPPPADPSDPLQLGVSLR